MLELFIIFAFSNDETDAAERIELVPGGANGVARKSILESMGGFKLEDVHCFDPNEEIKLRSVVAEVGGEEKFVDRIRALADNIRAKDKAEASRGEGNDYCLQWGPEPFKPICRSMKTAIPFVE